MRRFRHRQAIAQHVHLAAQPVIRLVMIAPVQEIANFVHPAICLFQRRSENFRLMCFHSINSGVSFLHEFSFSLAHD